MRSDAKIDKKSKCHNSAATYLFRLISETHVRVKYTDVCVIVIANMLNVLSAVVGPAF